MNKLIYLVLITVLSAYAYATPVPSGVIRGRNTVTTVRTAYASTGVTTAAYVQIIASTSGAINNLQIFDSCGQTLKLAVGGAGVEVDQILIFPGGNGDTGLYIAAGSRVSLKAVSGNCAAGESDINFQY